MKCALCTLQAKQLTCMFPSPPARSMGGPAACRNAKCECDVSYKPLKLNSLPTLNCSEVILGDSTTCTEKNTCMSDKQSIVITVAIETLVVDSYQHQVIQLTWKSGNQQSC